MPWIIILLLNFIRDNFTLILEINMIIIIIDNNYDICDHYFTWVKIIKIKCGKYCVGHVEDTDKLEKIDLFCHANR